MSEDLGLKKLMKLMCMPPLTAANPTVLILGSMPGGESLKRQQYFAFKQNRFWRIMFKCFGKELSDDYSDRKKLIEENGLALWDVIQHCERINSADQNIKNETPVDLERFLTVHPSVELIVLNGRKAESVYKRYFGGLKIESVCLPSTSPANASCGFDRLFEAWSAVIPPKSKYKLQ